MHGFEITVLKEDRGRERTGSDASRPPRTAGPRGTGPRPTSRPATDDGSVGDFTLRASKTRRGLPVVNAVDEDLTAANAATTKDSLAKQPDMIAFFEDTFTRYLFNSFGAIVDDDSVDYALETQTKAGLLGGGRRGHRRA